MEDSEAEEWGAARVRGEVAIRDASYYELLMWVLIAGIADEMAPEIAEGAVMSREASGRAEVASRDGGRASVEWSKTEAAVYTIRWAGPG